MSRNLKKYVGLSVEKDRTVNFLDYFQAYINSYTKKDIRMVQIALSRFKDFLKEQYPMNEFSIKPELITKEMMEQFVAYLQSRSVGEGAKSIYQRFKKVIRYAIDHDVMLKDPCKSVTCKVDSQMLRKMFFLPKKYKSWRLAIMTTRTRMSDGLLSSVYTVVCVSVM